MAHNNQHSKNQAKKKAAVSEHTVNEADAMAKATARPGQTKEQTKLIAQGIQKGIDEYKKRQKGKARELDKKLKKVKQTTSNPQQIESEVEVTQAPAQPKLAWILLGLSWVGFIAYIALMSK